VTDEFEVTEEECDWFDYFPSSCCSRVEADLLSQVPTSARALMFLQHSHRSRPQRSRNRSSNFLPPTCASSTSTASNDQYVNARFLVPSCPRLTFRPFLRQFPPYSLPLMTLPSESTNRDPPPVPTPPPTPLSAILPCTAIPPPRTTTPLPPSTNPRLNPPFKRNNYLLPNTTSRPTSPPSTSRLIYTDKRDSRTERRRTSRVVEGKEAFKPRSRRSTLGLLRLRRRLGRMRVARVWRSGLGSSGRKLSRQND
jgi:hypothetical protein